MARFDFGARQNIFFERDLRRMRFTILVHRLGALAGRAARLVDISQRPGQVRSTKWFAWTR
jgi:hypothetical protein